MPEISIILCTYNRENLLPNMLDSLLAQTFSDFEIVLIDNGSTDRTHTVCQRYAEADNRFRIFHIERNQGAARARNLGLEHAAGTYISFVDDDDACAPDMYEVLHSLARRYQADISVTGGYKVYGEKRIPFYLYDGVYVLDRLQGMTEFLLRRLYNTVPGTKLFHRRLFEEIRWPEGTLVDDIHVIYKLFAKAECTVACGKPGYYWVRNHGTNMTGFWDADQLSPEILKEYLEMQDERVNYLDRYLPGAGTAARYARISYMLSMVRKLHQSSCEGCMEYREQMKQYLHSHEEELLDTVWVTEQEKKWFSQYIEKAEEHNALTQ